MSFWIELHCDHRKDGTDPADILRARCYTNENANVMGHARNPSHARTLISQLEARALRQGWVKRGRKWACPGCKNGGK